ncbi:metallophosphoesterase family protein [Candidatus Bipolaricaulota bacterium]
MRYVLGILAMILVTISTTAAAPFVHEPYSGAPSEESVTISWASESPLPARIEYGSLAYFLENQEFEHRVDVAAPEEALSDTQHVILQELPKADQCAYRVILIDGETEYASEVGQFCTTPPPSAPVNFVVLSDTQNQLEGVNRLELVGSAIANDPMGFDFILHAGDIVESPSSFYWDDWFASFSGMLARAPFIPVPGNHEKNHRSYYANFEFPPGAGKNDERWWAFHWGDVVVVGIDTNVRSATDIRAQTDWAREHLSGPEPHKFVIFHHPVFTSDSEYGTGNFYDTIFHPVFVETNVDIVFNGHSHHYERINRDDVTYMVVGGGGATPRQTRPDHIQGSDVSVEGHHFYVRVATSDEGIRVETVSVARETGTTAIATDGQLLDSFELVLPVSEVPATRSSTLVWVIVFAVVLAASFSGTWIYLRRRQRRKTAS